MAPSSLAREVVTQLERLPLEQQRQVLDFARALAEAKPRGVPGSALLQFAGAIPLDDLAAMARAIEGDCERIDPDEW